MEGIKPKPRRQLANMSGPMRKPNSLKKSMNGAACVLLCGAVLSSCGKNRDVSNIERVLAQDMRINEIVATAAEVVLKMREIDTNGCPADFKAAYLAHVHAWEGMAQVEQQVKAFNATVPTSVVVDSVVQMFSGRLFGTYNDIRDTEIRLNQSARKSTEEVQQTFHRVEEIAISYGASLPKPKP